MKVFISWSGERSQALAHALRDWLPLVLHYVEPWLSGADIEAGQRWADEVAKGLESSNFGIICVARENLSSPWILFEAGALAKSMQGSRVIPLLLDLEFGDITGPLAQFQAKKVEKAGIDEVIQSINSAEDNAVPVGRAKELYEALWPRLEEKVAAIPDDAPKEKSIRPQHEILEELVASVRGLDSRVRDATDEPARHRRFGRRRFHPFMLHDLAHRVGSGPGDPLGLLIGLSAFREDLPWLYELGLEVYHAVKSGDAGRAERATKSIGRAMEFFDRGHPMAEELGLDPRMMQMMHMFVREMEDLLPRKLPTEDDPETDVPVTPIPTTPPPETS